jgi:hypothetical protein
MATCLNSTLPSFCTQGQIYYVYFDISSAFDIVLITFFIISLAILDSLPDMLIDVIAILKRDIPLYVILAHFRSLLL